jgi:hypothetical protein
MERWNFVQDTSGWFWQRTTGLRRHRSRSRFSSLLAALQHAEQHGLIPGRSQLGSITRTHAAVGVCDVPAKAKLETKRVRIKNIAVLVGYGLFVFMSGMAYEHYTSASAIEEIRASFAVCPPAGRQFRADAL